MNGSLISEFFAAMPEIFIAGMAMLLLIVGVFRGDRRTGFVAKSAILILVLSSILVAQLWGGSYQAMDGLFKSDGFSVLIKVLIALSAAAVLFMSLDFFRSQKGRFEYPVITLFAVVGMMIMVSANDLIVMYMGLELQSLSLYVLASFDRDSTKSSEAGLKYFVLGALSSGLLLYGCSLLYGFTGTTNFDSLAGVYQADQNQEVVFGVLLGVILVIIGVCFKVSAVPFHMWTPDVYEGSPTTVTAFLASAPKVAAMALFLRVSCDVFGGMADQWRQVVIFVSIASMLIGAIGALKQTNIKRLLAYSSIGHVGYMLVGIAAGGVNGVQSTLIYLVIYAIMNVGTFACVLSMKKRGEALEKISDFAGLAKTNPVFAMVVSVLMFSMTGIPPLAGFFGKFFVFRAAVEGGLYGLAVVGVLTSVIAAFYYIRIIKLMYFDETEDEMDDEVSAEIKWVIAGASAFNLLYFIFPTRLLELTKVAASTLLL